MRVLHCTDFHGNSRWLDWLIQTAPVYDLICLSGDLLNLLDDGSIVSQQSKIKKCLAKINVPVAVSSGNHDMVHAENCEGGRLWVADLKRDHVWVDGDRFQLGGYDFYCHGWNEPVPVAGPDEIWVIHSPPEGCAAAVNEFAGDFGDHEFSVLCRSGCGPKLALCGHVHSPQAWSAQVGITCVLNPGHIKSAPWPSHIIVDLETGTATRRCPGHPDETISFRRQSPYEILRGISDEQLEDILQAAVINLRIEGHPMTPEEIDRCRQRLRQAARGGVVKLPRQIRTSAYHGK